MLPGPSLTTPALPAPTVTGGTAATGVAHQERLQRWCALTGSASGTHRRGSAWQQPQRVLEQAVRDQALAFRHWARAQGLN